MLKYASLIVIFGCAAAVFAAPTTVSPTTQAPVDPEITALVKRAQDLLNQANKAVEAHKAAGRSHLLDAVRLEMHNMEFTAVGLETIARVYPGKVRDIAKLKEELEIREKRMVEELAFVETVFKIFNPSNKTFDELVQFGDKLIADGKAVLASQPTGAKAEDLKVVENEVKGVEAAMHHVKGLTRPGYHVEEILLRHELTLSAAIARVQSAK